MPLNKETETDEAVSYNQLSLFFFSVVVFR